MALKMLTRHGHMIWYIQYLLLKLNEMGEWWGIKEEHGKDCVDEGFQMARAKLGRGGEGGSEVISEGFCIIII